MSGITLALVIFGVMVLFMMLRTPISVSMFIAGITGFMLQSGWPSLSNFLNTQTFARFASYDLSVIPLFILMGNFATQGGISRSLFEFASVVMSRFRGGLAMAAVLASAAFGAICGSSVATAATITSVALPEMKRHGYSDRLSTGVLAAGGTLGILIPPSVPLVIYAILAEQNIAKLFAAAMLPGIIAMVGYMLAIGIYVRVVPGHAPDRDDASRMSMKAMIGILPIAVVFTLVFGGIYGGLFTPTEGAAVGAASTFLAALLKRELTIAKIQMCFRATAETSAMIFMIFIGADIMNASLAMTQVPTQLGALVMSLGLHPLIFVTGILLLYVVLGAVMDEMSMILLTIPIFFPIIMGMDFGMPKESTAIWFGIMVLMTVGFGMLAPPVGLNVYVVNSMAENVPISESYKGVTPFLISDTIRTILLLFFPSISLWLVKYLS
jgi:tripartite ATP-independent transporter DctM subunit